MKIDGIIYTTSTSQFVQKALPAIYKRIALAKGIEVAEFKIKEVRLPQMVPTKSIGLATRIDFDWLRERYKTDGRVLALHISKAEAKRLKLRHSKGGALGGFYYRNEGDDTLEFFIIADTIPKIVEKFTHELAHGLFHWSNAKDLTHEFTNARLDDAYRAVDFTKWNVLFKVKNAVEATVAALRANLGQKPATQVKLPVKDLLPLVKRKADKLVKEMELFGFPIRITEGYRSLERQNELYAQGRTKPGAIVTKAKAGESLHNYGVAIDVVFRKQGYDATPDQWLAMASVAEGQGFEWGGSQVWVSAGFQDKPHLEMRLGYSLKDFQTGKVDYNKFN